MSIATGRIRLYVTLATRNATPRCVAYKPLLKRVRNKQVKAREHCDGAHTSVCNPSSAERNAEMRSL